MTRAVLAFFILALGMALTGTQSAAANEVSDYQRTRAAVERLEGSASRLMSTASRSLDSEQGSSAEVYADVVATEAAFEYFIGHAGKLLTGDMAADIALLTRMLEELRALKEAKADLLGRMGEDARTAATSRAFVFGQDAVATARHLRASLGCLRCEV